MYSIRKGVFETNSSSVHSLAIAKSGLEPPHLKVGRRIGSKGKGKYIIVELGEFEKDPVDYFSQDEKLSYLATLSYLTDGGENLEELYDSYNFQGFEEIIIDYVNEYDKDVLGIWIDPATIDIAHIDHQTINEYNGISDFPYAMNVDFIDFVFNKNIGLHTDCD